MNLLPVLVPFTMPVTKSVRSLKVPLMIASLRSAGDAGIGDSVIRAIRLNRITALLLQFPRIHERSSIDCSCWPRRTLGRIWW